MLGDLIKELTKLKSEINSVDFQSIPEEQRVAVITALADKVLNTLDNADIKIPEGDSDDGGIEIPTSEI